MLKYGMAISLIMHLTSCGIPDFEKEFAFKHKITLDFLGSHRSEESILGGFSGRMYAYKGKSLCNTNYYEVREGDFDQRKIFKKYDFDTKKACLLLDKSSKNDTEWKYIIADDSKIYFYENWT